MSQSPNHQPAPSEELDLMIHDMHSPADEAEVKAVLEKLPAIQAVRLVEGGAWIRYNPIGIGKDEITTAIRQVGYRASTFQDSKTGDTGVSSQ